MVEKKELGDPTAVVTNVMGRISTVPEKLFTPSRQQSAAKIDVTKVNPSVSTIERLAQKKGVNTEEERFRVMPDYAYPNTKMNRDELRTEMNKKSFFFHNLRLPKEPKGIGQVALEILQCFGLPKPDSTLGSEASAFCIAVCGSYAFRTDTMPPVANPMWLSKMRRAAIFPVFHAYAKIYIGVFGHNPESRRDGFAGRIVVDLSSLRPNCTYEMTLPLRRSAHVYSREQRGAIRIRVNLSWFSDRSAILSYIPKKPPKLEPQEDVVVNCCDAKSFQNVARVVHGEHMPGRFTTKQLRATIKEIQVTRITILRRLRKQEFRNLTQWRVPIISAFLFGAWMHSVFTATLKYVPGHLITLILLYIWKNYAFYRVQPSAIQNGFVAPSWEEMMVALLFGRPNTIAPLQMRAKTNCEKSVLDDMTGDKQASNTIFDVAKVFRSDMKTHRERHHMRLYRDIFKGKEAVDFLIARGYADSREKAVAIGQKLMEELKVFRTVSKKVSNFRDASSMYHFTEYDPLRYTLKTYRPRGKRLFEWLGFLPEKEPEFEEAQMEMPYTTGREIPRLTVKESVVIRSKESRRMMEDEMDGQDDPNLTQSQKMVAGLNEFLEEDDKTVTVPPEEEDQATSALEGVDEFVIKYLKPPPPQNIDFKPTQKGRHITEVVAEARHKVHGFLLGHAFNDRVYPKPNPSQFYPQITPKIKIGKGRVRKILSRSNTPSESENGESPELTNPAAIEDEYNKLLDIGIYSHSNPLIRRMGVVVQPVVEMFVGGLCLFRALFNLFTWRDPILTFWVTLVGPLVVGILHLFPWRPVLGIAGIYLFGPQNYLFRLYREYRYGPEEFDPDKIVKKKKKAKEPKDGDAPVFSMYAPDNQPISVEDMDTSRVRKVVVPYSPLTYQRFYDFPPETEYARVVSEKPPSAELLDASRVVCLTKELSHSTRASKRPFRKIREGIRKRR